LFSLDPGVERRQVDHVAVLRRGRDTAAWRHALDAVGTAAHDASNLVPPIIAAVEAKATIGEISDTLRQVFGVYEEAATL
jgi:methylmalonyl-CoA mutase N-terminal domain/subunit